MIEGRTSNEPPEKREGQRRPEVGKIIDTHRDESNLHDVFPVKEKLGQNEPVKIAELFDATSRENTDEGKKIKTQRLEIPQHYDTATGRLKGELEQAHNIEPLPPTPITDEAKARLEEWGVPEEFITKLQNITASMRYDLVPEKAERMAKKGGYSYEKPDGTEMVVLPDATNGENRGDGQCSEISAQCVVLLHSSGFLTELNTSLKNEGKPEMRPVLLYGNSRTHFVANNPQSTHDWVGLLPEGSAIEDIITVDPSFQEISNTDTNGYTARKLIEPSSITYNPALELPVGTYTEDESGNIKSSHFTGTNILGASADREIAYQLSFVKSASGMIRPQISSIRSDGSLGLQAIANSKGDIFLSDNTDKHAEEIKTIVASLANIQIEQDQDKANNLLTEEKNVHF